MEQPTKSTKTATCLLFFFISFYVILSSLDRPASGYCAPLLTLLAAFLVALLVVFAARTTLVTWITVVVLLAFAGKRRRVLAREGRKITSDVAMFLVRVVIEERSFVAFACAAIVSLVGMAWLGLARNNQSTLKLLSLDRLAT